MELTDILARAGQILDEERAVPTAHYDWVTLTFLAVPLTIQEDPRQFIFAGDNYNLLCALQNRSSSDTRSSYIDCLLQRMSQTAPPACALTYSDLKSCYWDGFASELPLVAEFCVRNGGTQAFLKALAKAQATPGTVILLRHLTQMVAVNFRIFSEAEYEDLSGSIQVFRVGYDSAAYRVGERVIAGRSVWNAAFFRQLKQSASLLQEYCRKARYFYLKHSLLEGLNIEINQDKDAVQSNLKALGFSELLAQSLEEAERLYLDGASPFNLKASMGHLRSFLENLHKEAFPTLRAKFGGDLPPNWGKGLVYLRENGVLSKKEEEFVASLYTIVSDEAIHPVVAERQYARLFRNVVIEYALLLLWKLEKAGVKR